MDRVFTGLNEFEDFVRPISAACDFECRARDEAKLSQPADIRQEKSAELEIVRDIEKDVFRKGNGFLRLQNIPPLICM